LGNAKVSGGSPSEYQGHAEVPQHECYGLSLMRLRSTSEAYDQSVYRPTG